MLRRITAKQFRQWQAYFALEPTAEDRADARMAFIVMWMLELQRNNKEQPEPIKLLTVLSAFRDSLSELVSEEAAVYTKEQLHLLHKSKMMDMVIRAKAAQKVKERAEKLREERAKNPKVIRSRRNRPPQNDV